MEALVGLGGLCGFGAAALFFLYALMGFLIVQPRTKVVVLRFGKYRRTIDDEGISYVFPLGRKIFRISTQVVSLDLPRTMVLDANGNPIEVSAVCAYRVREAERAALQIGNLRDYAFCLASAVVKNVCSHYPYETADPHQPCLKKESQPITDQLMRELSELVEPAGIEVLSVRLNDLTYAPEIAQSMLLRQQALAMVEARRTIVEGAVWTVQNALAEMSRSGLVMDAASAESFASNLMLVLCSGERVQTFMPISVETDGGAR